MFTDSFPPLHALPGDTRLVCLVNGTTFYLCPYVSKRSVLDSFGESVQFLVHQLKFRTDSKDDLHPFLLCHLVVTETGLPDVLDNLDTVQNNLPIYLVPVGREGNGKGITRMVTELLGELFEVTGHLVYLMVESVNLCRIDDDGLETVKIVVELPLQVCGSFNLLLDPDMACTFKQHHLFLLLQLLLGLVCIEDNHTCQGWVYALCEHFSNADRQE